MADQQQSVDKARPSTGSISARSKTSRLQKITSESSLHESIPPPLTREQLSSTLPRSHTPGHLSSKSLDKKKQSILTARQRSQSMSKANLGGSKSPPPLPLQSSTVANGEPRMPDVPPVSSTFQTSREDVSSASATTSTTAASNTATAAAATTTAVVASRPSALRSTSAISASAPSPTARSSAHASRSLRGQHTWFPQLPDPKLAPDVAPAPPSGMYWSRAPTSGSVHTNLRAHTTTLIGSNVYVFGGCDARTCFNELYVFDADSFHWSSPHVVGDIPVPLRAMTCTAVGKKLVIFGGGDGPAYYNDVYVLDTVNFRWTKPKISGTAPSPRRAHTACLHRNGIYVFGGGDGVRALNDIWRLDVADVTKMSWKLVSAASSASPPPTSNSSSARTKDDKPKARGYHTANIVGSKLIIYGGSDGGECFRDVWIFDVETHVWRSVDIKTSFPRLSHTATIVGSYLFVIGGHDGVEYSNDVLLLNLVTMQWDKRRIYGQAPSGRGYHGTVLHDSRLFVLGGFDGTTVFGEVWMLELAVHAYYSQISHFTIEV